MSEENRKEFLDAIDALIQRVPMFSLPDGTEEGRMLYGFTELMTELEICPICSGQPLHDFLGIITVKTEAGQIVAVSVVDIDTVYQIIAAFKTRVTVRLMELYSRIDDDAAAAYEHLKSEWDKMQKSPEKPHQPKSLWEALGGAEDLELN